MRKRSSVLPNIENYELTFKVTGLSFLFTDMLMDGFKYLEPLFTSDEQGNFSQYFTNRKMRYAARYGMRWFGTPGSFREYQREFTKYYESSAKALDQILASKSLSKGAIKKFYKTLSSFLARYSRMDNQFTNLAYVHQDGNSVIRKNLYLLAEFKDKARVWINNSVIDETSYFSQFCGRLCQALTIERGDLDCYRIAEILRLLDGVRVSRREIEDRRFAFCMFYLAGRHEYLAGKPAANFINSVSSKKLAGMSSEIKGKVANRVSREVSGRAMVINVDYGKLDLMNRAISEMNKGDILVADFTAPELMEACKKAKAIVTDIGGLLSHAAIVSRELGIPCLVGTGNATKIIKTGDQITIDFDSGIVRHFEAVSH
jgi:phosphohistidine swiveling domain-containing protein